MFGKITVHCFISGKRESNAGGDQPMRLFGRILADDGECDLPWANMFQSLAARDQFAVRGKNRGDAYDVARGDSRAAECELKAATSLAMFADAFGEKKLLSDERHGAG